MLFMCVVYIVLPCYISGPGMPEKTYVLFVRVRTGRRANRAVTLTRSHHIGSTATVSYTHLDVYKRQHILGIDYYYKFYLNIVTASHNLYVISTYSQITLISTCRCGLYQIWYTSNLFAQTVQVREPIVIIHFFTYHIIN